MSFKSIVVLESDWENKSPHFISVWPMISEFAKVYEVEAFYKFFSDGQSLAHWVRLFNESDLKKPTLLYIAAHGLKHKLIGISRAIDFEFVLHLITAADKIPCVHLACCHIGSNENLSKMLKAATHLRWISGYGTSMNWVDSLAFDLLFFSSLAKRQYERKGMHSHRVVNELLNNCPGLARDLDFRFKFRQGALIKEVSMSINKGEA